MCGQPGHFSRECRPIGKGGQTGGASKGGGKRLESAWTRGFHGFCDICGIWGHSKKYCPYNGESSMRLMGDESGWSEEPMEEESNDIPPVCCLREAVEEGGGIRTLEQEMSEDEAAKMNYPRPMPPRGGKWRAMFCLQKAG